LRKLENHDRKERVNVDEYTIEHILPQNPNLSETWKQALGHDWENVRETWLHTLGNLTLTGYNSEYSDRPFSEKRDMEGGFKDSPLRINQGLGQLDSWDKEAIIKRAKVLSELAVTVWQMPQLEMAVLESYRPRPEIRTEYTIEDHPYLAEGSAIYGDSVRQLFEAFRKEVLALDPVVTEEFLKYYVAYKAETNFVDIIPQAKRLVASINIPFSEIIDPRDICKDVSGLGHWGNGDVEAGFSSVKDLPYIIGLVRQSFERQMGNGGEE
jgi:predicted transport protein